MSVFNPTKQEIIEQYREQVRRFQRSIELVEGRIKKLEAELEAEQCP